MGNSFLQASVPKQCGRINICSVLIVFFFPNIIIHSIKLLSIQLGRVKSGDNLNVYLAVVARQFLTRDLNGCNRASFGDID